MGALGVGGNSKHPPKWLFLVAEVIPGVITSPLAVPVFSATTTGLPPAEMQLLWAGPIYWKINYFWQKKSQNFGNTLAVIGIWLSFINGRAFVSPLFSCCGRSVPDLSYSGVNDPPWVEFLLSTWSGSEWHLPRKSNVSTKWCVCVRLVFVHMWHHVYAHLILYIIQKKNEVIGKKRQLAGLVKISQGKTSFSISNSHALCRVQAMSRA